MGEPVVFLDERRPQVADRIEEMIEACEIQGNYAYRGIVIQ